MGGYSLWGVEEQQPHCGGSSGDTSTYITAPHALVGSEAIGQRHHPGGGEVVLPPEQKTSRRRARVVGVAQGCLLALKHEQVTSDLPDRTMMFRTTKKENIGVRFNQGFFRPMHA